MEDKKPLVSIIFPVKNEGEHIQNTLNSLFSTKTEYPLEVIVVDDNSEDGCCDFLRQANERNIKLVYANNAGVANTKNIGADYAKGEYLIFCDAHLFFEDYWIDRLLEPLKLGMADCVNPGIAVYGDAKTAGFGYTWNENLEPKWNVGRKDVFAAPLLAGGCMAMPKKVFDDIEGFERGFKIWGREDEEVSFKLWLFGYKCCAVPSVTVIHVFRTGAVPFTFTWDDVNYNFMRMAYSHLNEERIEKCKKLIKYSNPDKIVEEVLKSDVMQQRERYLKKRKYDDDWYMKQFNIPF
ncbi:glycosyltransferase family 2 protein [Bacillus salipaludis]|uniref:glycosyltransferase family 2 protein n=1 Tax=Bacillus salipaludis TaxID=2547811 RepID=UPI002E21A2E9|nr:glycosyltransferase [Bacillus salipaludis]